MTKQLLSLAAAVALTGVGAAKAGDLPPALGSASGQVLDAATMSNITGTDATASVTVTNLSASTNLSAPGLNSTITTTTNGPSTTTIVNTGKSVSPAGSAISASLFVQAVAQ